MHCLLLVDTYNQLKQTELSCDPCDPSYSVANLFVNAGALHLSEEYQFVQLVV